MKVHIDVDIEASVDSAWAALVDFPTHTQWMHDAVGIRFVGDQRAGVGTTFDCDTRVGPLRTTDRMHVTKWVDHHLVGVRHVGVVTGEGAFRVNDTPTGARVSWSETLSFPWFFGGRIGEVVARPLLSAVWKRNLSNLKGRLEP